MTRILKPGFDVDPVRVKLSEHWEKSGNELLPVQLLRREGCAFQLSIADREPVWAWLWDPELVDRLFEWFYHWDYARYDDRQGLLKVWSGSFLGIVCPLIAAPEQRASSGELLSDVMRRSERYLN